MPVSWASPDARTPHTRRCSRKAGTGREGRDARGSLHQGRSSRVGEGSSTSPRATEDLVAMGGCRCMTKPQLPDRTKQVHLPFPADQRRGDRWRLHPCGRRFEHEPRRDGVALALRFDRDKLFVSERTVVWPDASPHRRSNPPGGADVWRRAAVLTTSPRASASPDSARDPSATIASPVLTAARAARSREAGSLAVQILDRCRGPRVLRAPLARRHRPAETGAPNTAITASPMNFSIVPPNCRTCSFAPSVIRLERFANILGDRPLTRPSREADQIDEQDGHELAFLRCRRRGDERRPAVQAEAGPFDVLSPRSLDS